MNPIETFHGAASALAWLASANAQAAVLTVVVLALRAALGRWLTPGWRGALWLLIALRLLVPLAIESRYSLAALGRQMAASRAIADSPQPAVAAPRVSVTYAPIQRDALVAPPTVVQRRPSSASLAIGIWLAGVALLVVRDLVGAVALRRDVRRMRPVDDASVLALLARCAAEVGVRRPVRLVETNRLRVPAVCGILRPAILLPAGAAEAFSPAEMRMVLLHELVHVRRDDALLAAFFRFVVAIHWFNPLVWIGAAAFRADRELACDAAVLGRLADAEARRAYGDCLIRVVADISGRRARVAGLGLFGTTGSLRRRIHMIADRSERASFPRRGFRLLIGASAAAAIGCAAVAGEPATSIASDPATRPTARAPSPAGATATVVRDRVAAALDAPMGVDFPRELTSFSDALDLIRTSASVPIFVNWNAIEAAGIDGQKLVALAVTGDVKRRKVLQLILASAGGGNAPLGFTVDEGVLTISTQEDLARNVATRAFDVRDLLVQIPNFPADGPATQPAGTAATRQELVSQLTQLLTDTIESNTWKANGGMIGSIQEIGGQLIITQTPATLDAVAQLLTTLREGRGVQVMVEARFVAVDPALVPTILGRSASDAKPGEPAATMLSDAQVAEFLRQVQSGKDAATLTAPRLTLFNGQSAYVKVATPTSYISNYTMTQAAGGERRFEPQTAEAISGVTLEVQATLSADRRYVTLTLGPTVTRLVRLESVPFAGDPKSGLSVQKPVMENQSIRTTVSVADGGTLLLSAGLISGDLGRPETGGAVLSDKGAPRQVLLLIKPVAIVAKGQAARE